MTTDLQKVILITGCSTGIGMATAVCLATDPARIYKVYAAMRSLEKKEALEKAAKDCLGQTLHIRQLDVCSDEHADKVVDEIFAKEGRLDILVNSDDLRTLGPLEVFTMGEIRSICNTNLFGVIRLTKKVLPIMKKQNSGHLVTISSFAGTTGIPFNSIYCASKFGIEGFCESLAVECTKANIKVSVIEPGPVSSYFEENCADQVEMDKADEATKSLAGVFVEKSTSVFAAMAQTPEDIARVVLEAITSSNPHFRYFTNRVFTSAVSQKFVDPTGNTPIEDMRKKYMTG